MSQSINRYDEAIHDTMVEEGILWSFAAICKSVEKGVAGVTNDVEMTRMCSTAFCNLTCNYGTEFMTSMATIKSLFWQTTSDDLITRQNAAQAVLNILSKVNDETVEIAEMSVKYLKNLCMQEVRVSERSNVNENDQRRKIIVQSASEIDERTTEARSEKSVKLRLVASLLLRSSWLAQRRVILLRFVASLLAGRSANIVFASSLRSLWGSSQRK